VTQKKRAGSDRCGDGREAVSVLEEGEEELLPSIARSMCGSEALRSVATA